MTTRKSGRDDSAIRRAAEEAAEARKVKNRRGNKGSRAAKGGKNAASKGRGRRKQDSDSEASFLADDDELDEDDDFIAHSEEEELSDELSEMEGDWNENLEDDDSFVGKRRGNKKSSKKPSRGKKTQETRLKRGRERKKVVYDVDGTDSGESCSVCRLA